MIVSMDVTNNGGDGGQMSPTHETVCETYGKTPAYYVVDSGFSTIENITAVEELDSRVVAPMTHEDRITNRGGDPHACRTHDTDAMFAFRQRMTTEDSKAILKQRPSIVEYPNAFCHNRSLHQFRVRSLEKVRPATLWYAFTFNFLRKLHLGVL